MEALEQLFRMADETAADGVALLSSLIRFETVNTGVMPTGNELPVCRWLQDWLGQEGIAAQVLESGEGRGNLVARLPGRTGRPRLLYMGHLDVVPVEDPAEWRFPPFSGTVAEGRMWGRGAADMKDMVAAELMALVLLRRAGVALQGDLIVASCADEETGGQHGFGWLAQHAPQVIAADYAINEGGGGPIPLSSAQAYVIQVGEKGRWEVHFTLRGRSGHAASPWQSDNASYKLGELLRRIQAWKPEIDVSLELFSRLGELLSAAGLHDGQQPITPENVDALAQAIMPVSRGLSGALRGLSRMTLVPTVISGGVKTNSVPAMSRLVCDVRTLPHQDEAYLRCQVEQIVAGMEGVSYELEQTAVSNASPYDTPLRDAIQKATAAAAGRDNLHWLPGLMTGFSDSRLVRPLGGVVYGFAPEHPGADLTFPSGVHGANESSSLATLLFRTKLLLSLALELLGGDRV